MHRTLEFARELQRAIARDNCEEMQSDLVDILYDYLKYQPETDLSIRSERMGQFSAALLARRLQSANWNILDLYNNRLSAESVSQLLKLNVSRLNIGGNNLTQLKPLVDFLHNETTSLEVLELGNPNGFSFPEYNANGEPERVAQNHFEITAILDIFKALEQNRSIKYLGLSGNDLAEASTAFPSLFKQNHVLTAIDLSYCGLGNHGTATLLRSLLSNSSITYLNIRGNGFTMLVANLLSTLLESSPNLTYLNISDNPIGAEGARAVACGLAANCSLEQLEMEACAIGDQGVSFICSVLAQDTEIQTAELVGGEVNFFDELQQIFNRVDDDILHERKITLQDHTGTVLEEVQLHRRSRIDFSYDKGSRARSGTKHFRVKRAYPAHDLSEGAGGSGAGQNLYFRSPLPPQAQNESLMASQPGEEPPSTTDASADCSLANNYADSVAFDTPQIDTYDGVVGSGLTHLNISYNSASSLSFNYVCSMLKRLSSLRRLNISGTRLNAKCCIQLSNVLVGAEPTDYAGFAAIKTPNSREDSDEIDFRSFKRQIAHNQPLLLTSLALSGCYVTNAGFLPLCAAFERLPELTNVDLSDNFISRTGEVGMTELLGHQSLMSFKMRGNEVSHSVYNRLRAVMQENRLKIARSGPGLLEVKISRIRREIQRLPRDRESLEFLQKSALLYNQLLNSVESQQIEAEDVGERQCRGVATRAEAVRQETLKLQEGCEAAVSKEKAIQQKQYNNELIIKQSLTEEQENFDSEVSRLEEKQSYIEGAEERKIERIAEIRQQLLAAEREIQEMQETLQKANEYKQIILQYPKFADLAKRAFAGSAAGKIALRADYSSIVTVLQRAEFMIEGKPIPRPLGYEIAEVALTPLKKRRKTAGRRRR